MPFKLSASLQLTFCIAEGQGIDAGQPGGNANEEENLFFDRNDYEDVTKQMMVGRPMFIVQYI